MTGRFRRKKPELVSLARSRPRGCGHRSGGRLGAGWPLPERHRLASQPRAARKARRGMT